jgi:hypothetical protein
MHILLQIKFVLRRITNAAVTTASGSPRSLPFGALRISFASGNTVPTAFVNWCVFETYSRLAAV